MHISFSPVRSDDRLNLSVEGDTLTINGEAFDFSGLPDGATLPQTAVSCDWLASDVERIDGDIHLTLILPHGARAPAETLFPDPVSVPEGPVPLPPHDTPPPEGEDA
jgi:hypothetical protein